jgi:type I site-specific restriction endonuclease
MIKLNFPDYTFSMTEKNGKPVIFDPARKKYVALTPEEWVRQHVIQFLNREKQVPLSLIGVETEIRLYKTRKRFDLAVFDRNGKPLLVTECKSPSVSVTQDVLDQAVRYNMTLKVSYLMLTNGIQHIYCQADIINNSIRIINDLPDFQGLC